MTLGAATPTAMGAHDEERGMLKWFVRRAIWDFLAWLKFRVCKPLNIKPPPTNRQVIKPKPMIEAIPEVPLRNVMVCAHASIPQEERSLPNTLFYRFQVWLYTAYSPMQPGLPEIDADPQVALKRAFTGPRRKLFRAPELPAEYLGSPDLGSLAVRGPFACYTTRVDDTTWEWDLRMLDDYEHHPGLLKIGARVLFRLDPLRRSLQADRIECALGTIAPTDPGWDQACKIALCAASTYLSLVRHFNWVHLAGGAQLAIATRNRLSANHPLCRLLWPYIFATFQSNDIVTRGQMVRGGDFETTFSLTFEGMCRLFDDSYLAYPHLVNDPEADGNARGVRGAGFDTPTQDNLEALFDVMHRFVCNYLEIYYPRNGDSGPDGVHGDAEVLAWLEELNARVPNGVGVGPNDVTWDKLATLLASQLYLVTVQHEILGSCMWDYQLWTHRQPARVYEDFRREPLDVYQRLVNANYNLNVHRRALMDDFTCVALDYRAKAAMLQFQSELAGLQAAMDGRPGAVWRLSPRELKVNINA
jgi:arachidonate 15-lipoxygenase